MSHTGEGIFPNTFGTSSTSNPSAAGSALAEKQMKRSLLKALQR